jgi:polysaccharide export outer membrane protein
MKVPSLLLAFLLTAPDAATFAVAQQPKEPTAASATAALNPPQSTTPDNYIMGPGDMVQIFVWRNPELSVTVPVRPDGKISTPLVEDMIAVGKTPTLLARDLEAVLAEYIRAPKVNVIVSQPLSTFSQVKIIGQVLKPQAFPYRQGLTVLDAVLAVGGLSQFAAGNRAKIVRTTAGKTKEIRVKLTDLVNGGDMRQNVALQPGDVLVVPQSIF